MPPQQTAVSPSKPTFGDGTTHRLEPGGLAWVDASTLRGLTNVGDDDVVYLCVGGKDGYVERDGVKVD